MSSRSLPPRASGPAAPAAGRPIARVEYPSSAPLVVGGALFAVSLGIAIVLLAVASQPVSIFPGIPLPTVVPELVALSILGYLLAPCVVLMAYMWDRTAQTSGRRRNPEFEFRPWQSTVLRVLVFASMVLGAWHVINIAVPLSEWLGLS